MKAFLLLLVLATTAGTATAGPPTLAETIRAAKWKKRVLLVAAPTAAQPDWERQKQLLATNPAGLAERDILVLNILHSQLLPADRQYLQQTLHLKISGFEVLLVGKDGGVKLRHPQPVAPQELFGLIDQMPMRRQEMRRK